MDLSLNLYSAPLSPLHDGLLFKRHLRIKTSRLPHDFFTHSPHFRYELTPLVSQELTLGLARSIQTPSFQRRLPASALSREGSPEAERKVETARAALEKADPRETMR